MDFTPEKFRVVPSVRVRMPLPSAFLETLATPALVEATAVPYSTTSFTAVLSSSSTNWREISSPPDQTTS